MGDCHCTWLTLKNGVNLGIAYKRHSSSSIRKRKSFYFTCAGMSSSKLQHQVQTSLYTSCSKKQSKLKNKNYMVYSKYRIKSKKFTSEGILQFLGPFAATWPWSWLPDQQEWNTIKNMCYLHIRKYANIRISFPGYPGVASCILLVMAIVLTDFQWTGWLVSRPQNICEHDMPPLLECLTSHF